MVRRNQFLSWRREKKGHPVIITRDISRLRSKTPEQSILRPGRILAELWLVFIPIFNINTINLINYTMEVVSTCCSNNSLFNGIRYRNQISHWRHKHNLKMTKDLFIAVFAYRNGISDFDVQRVGLWNIAFELTSMSPLPCTFSKNRLSIVHELCRPWENVIC